MLCSCAYARWARAHRRAAHCTGTRCCTPFIIPRVYLQRIVTSRWCHCLPIGINLHCLLSRSRCKPVALPSLSECARGQANYFRRRRRNYLREIACLLIPAHYERARHTFHNIPPGPSLLHLSMCCLFENIACFFALEQYCQSNFAFVVNFVTLGLSTPRDS